MSEPELKPCLSCKGEAEFVHVKMLGNAYFHKIKVRCSNCGIETVNFDDKERAAKVWNGMNTVKGGKV